MTFNFFNLSWVVFWCIVSEVVSISNDEIATLPVSNNQLSILAEYACMEYIHPIDKIRCQKNLSNRQTDTVLPPSEIQVRCISKNSITFSITPSEYMQLVVLEPVNDEAFVAYAVVSPNTEFSTIDAKSGNNYLWSTMLTPNGTAGWNRGPIVPQWVAPSENRTYVIDMTMPFNFTKGDEKLRGLFKWNSSDDMDSCFEILNYCEKRVSNDFFNVDIGPAEKRTIVVDNIIKDDHCTFQVKGKYGTTTLDYTTPCDLTVDCIPIPKTPANVSLIATQSPELGWDVLVQWLRPVNDPDSYNVTLYIDEEITQTVPGNATEVLFPSITYEGIYAVSVAAVSASGASHTSERDFLPRAPVLPLSIGLAVSSVWTATIICAAVLGTFILWRCRSEQQPTDKTSLKFPKEPIAEDIFLPASEDDSWEIFPERVTLHEVVGEGAFGVVRRGTLAGTCVAVKMLKDMPTREEIRSFRAEMELMKSVGSHPHVVSLVGCCTGRKPFIVAEYCGQGDLLTYLRRFWDTMVTKRNMKYYNNNIKVSNNYGNDILKGDLKEEEQTKFVVNKMYDMDSGCETELTALDLFSFCRQIAMGMEFLEANRVVHRDLAARNVLVTNDRTLKIADFGLSRDVYEDNQYKQAGPGKMPVKWMAPESLSRRIYTTKSDVWSFGVVVWEVWSVGRAPYALVAAHRVPALLAAGHRLPRPAACPRALYEVMLSCWRLSASTRPTFAALHARLDELLQRACTHNYLALDAPAQTAPTAPPAPTAATYKPARYVHLLLSKTKRAFGRGERYERPFPGSITNHYTSTPVTLSPPHIV